jgi:DNA-binding NarL/FixJ family response regulator
LTRSGKYRIQFLRYGHSTNTLAKSRSTQPLMTLRIFIVDDSDRVRDAIKALLSADSSSWLVCGEAVDGEQALERAAATRPDVILLDLSLPQVQGTFLATKLRDAIPSATVVIMSAQDPRLMPQFADSLGVEHFLPKSNLATDLIASLKNISREKRSAG